MVSLRDQLYMDGKRYIFHGTGYEHRDWYSFGDPEWTNDLVFNPREYGFFPGSIVVGDIRGWRAIYSLENEQLILRELHICSRDEYYPSFNGVAAAAPERDGLGLYAYRNLNFPVLFTGTAVISETERKEGLESILPDEPELYKTTYDLEFVQGKLQSMINSSGKYKSELSDE